MIGQLAGKSGVRFAAQKKCRLKGLHRGLGALHAAW